MTRRTRTFAGLLALAAMTASFSEAVLSSLCASPAAMASMSGMEMSVEDSDGAQESTKPGMPCDWLDHTEQSGEGSERCPLTPTATQGCSVAASAPAPVISVASDTVLAARHVRLDLVEPELLLAHALYHPPRA